MHLEQTTVLLESGNDLTADQCLNASDALTSEEVDIEVKKHFLLALSRKGETAAEVAAFASAFRQRAVNPGVEEWASDAIDIVGTGGDGAGTFNISTSVAFLVASCGVTVLKHGNRSITSKCGSADIIEAIGVPLNAPLEVLRASVKELNFCFFFAPAFHPSFKEIMPARKSLAADGHRSIFNLLGPLINPGRPAYQLMGVYSNMWVKPLADALAKIGLKSGLVVHGTPAPGQGLDELSCAGSNQVAGFGALSGVDGKIDAKDAGLSGCAFEALAGGDVAANLSIMNALFSGEASELPKGLIDTILLNAGAALWIAGRAASLKDGVNLAGNVLKSGQVKEWMDRVGQFYQSFA